MRTIAWVVFVAAALLAACAREGAPGAPQAQSQSLPKDSVKSTPETVELARQRLKEAAAEIQDAPAADEAGAPRLPREAAAEARLSEMDADLRGEIEAGDEAMKQAVPKAAIRHYENALGMIEMTPGAERLDSLKKEIEKKLAEARAAMQR
jgi:hypothetical protein